MTERKPLSPLRDRIKRFRQKLIRTNAAQALFAFLAATYIRIVYYTSKRTLIRHESLAPFFNGERNALFAFWHTRFLMIPPYKPKHRPMLVISSAHNDGTLSTRTLGHFGIKTVRGSTSSGGSKAAVGVAKALLKGGNIAVTPDGPRGPAQVLQIGIIYLSRMTGVPIIPVATASSKHKTLRSWDKMQIALPFGHLVMVQNEAIYVPKDTPDEALEDYRVKVEAALTQVLHDANEAAAKGA